MKTMTIRAWCCPTEGCPNYYGSSSQAALDLTAEANLESDLSHTVKTDPSHPRVTGNRGECPDCKRLGRGRVQRVPLTLMALVPTDAIPVPPPHAVATS